MVEEAELSQKETIVNEKTLRGAEGVIKQLVKQEVAQDDLATFCPNRLVTHTPEDGVNPLVDAASYLFSVIGKLTHIKSYRCLNKLQDELIQEINHFKRIVKETYRREQYRMEHVPIACYVLCVTLDDTIMSLSWGKEGHWNLYYSLSQVFYSDTLSRESFFSLLERIVQHPVLYIDVMEFVYLCFSLGMPGYQSTTFTPSEHQYLLDILYKHIRAYRGEFHKVLSPFPLTCSPVYTRPVMGERLLNKMIRILCGAILIAGILTIVNHIFTSSANQVQHQLLQIAKSNRLLTINSL